MLLYSVHLKVKAELLLFVQEHSHCEIAGWWNKLKDSPRANYLSPMGGEYPWAKAILFTDIDPVRPQPL